MKPPRNTYNRIETMKYSEVLKGLLFSMHSRRFLGSVISSIGAWVAWKYGVPNEVIAVIIAPIVTFIIGESYADGKARAAEALSDNAG